MYRNINFEKVTRTLSRLQKRVSERFPESGLTKVCVELQVIAAETESNLVKISKPNIWLRVSVAVTISLMVALVVYSVMSVNVAFTKITLAEVVQVTEAAVNDIVLFGLAIFFLITLESKLKRAKTISSLNELRAVAHIIDMHQLTKDPTEIGAQSKNTASSPTRILTPYQLKRYLDYCSEMLAILGKMAAVYAQHIPESSVVSSVNEIETLTSGISRKIWQKIMIVERTEVGLAN